MLHTPLCFMLIYLLGLKLEGASWQSSHLTLNDGQTIPLQASQLTWTKRDAVPKRGGLINVPVYLNGDRSEVLFSVDLESNGVGQDVIAQRGACLTVA
jgi:dynein heavy chain 1